MKRSIAFTFFIILLLSFQSNCLAVTRHALLIGIMDYEGTGLYSLEGPGNDIEIVHRLLIDRFGFHEENIKILMDEQATHSKIEKAFKDLAGQINSGDFIYIHYSGHGSLTPDLNGDEQRGKDQTWVSYGSRKDIKARQSFNNRDKIGEDNADPDNFDILDDEINQWLIPIYEKTDHVVFVSDSCHSASVTRGEAPKTRAVPIDLRIHPFGKRNLKRVKFHSGIRVGAAQDDESAVEFTSNDGESYGLFTWYWVKALQQARPGENWDDVFKRTSSQITTIRGISQHPRIEGKRNRQVLEGDFVSPSQTIPVTKVRRGGKKVRIKASSLQGVTKGSIYRLYSPEQHNKKSLPSIVISRINPFYSYGDVISALFKPGDLVVEDIHAYPFDPIKLYLGADLKEDQELIQKIEKKVANLSGFEITANQKNSDLVLYILRPEILPDPMPKNRNSQNDLATLPMSHKNQPSEVWILTPTERLFQENLKISLSDQDKGIKILLENLKKIARIRETKKLASSPNIAKAIEVKTILMTPVDSCNNAFDSDCITLPDCSHYKKSAPLSSARMEGEILKAGYILTFILKNNSGRDYYCYLLNISPDGKIEAIFPHACESVENALLKARCEFDLSDRVGVMLESHGEETIKIIATRDPIDISLLEQSEYRIRGKRQLNPLERLLSSAVHGTKRGDIPLRNELWTTLQFSFEVK